MIWRRRRPDPVIWILRVTTPEGIVLELDTVNLETVWRFGDRSTDGFVDLLEMPRLHLWAKPLGYVEPDQRITQLDGTAALPDGMRWRR